MDKRERQKEVFVELVNKQLEPFNITYTDVANDPDWYMRYRVTKEQEDNFIKWGVKRSWSAQTPRPFSSPR